MSETTAFYTLSHIFISLIGGVLLLAIWYNIRRRFIRILEENESEKRVDRGLLFLSFALFTWTISGCWVLFGSVSSLGETPAYTVGINLFSVLNNVCLLFAISYFYYAPKFIYQNKRNVLILTIIAIVVAGFTILFSNIEPEIQTFKYSALPDLILSGFLSYLLGLSLYRTFIKRGLMVIAILSVIVLLLMFLSQLPEVIGHLNDGFVNNIIKLVTKVSLIALFIVLATAWVIRLANMPKPDEVTLSFLDWSLVKISIPSKDIALTTVDFQSKTTQYKNLIKLAIRRKYGTGTEQSILVGPGGEIKNQTYLSRIIDNINAILELDPYQKLERRDLFTFIGEGRYRLRITPENITIDDALLSEAVNSFDEADYRKITDEAHNG